MSVTRVAYAADGWGVGELWFDGTVLVWHELPTPPRERPRSHEPRRLQSHPHPGGANSRRPAAQRPVRDADQVKGPGETGRFPPRSTGRSLKSGAEVRRIAHMVERYFQGDRVRLEDVELDLDDLTPFQLAIAEALRRVPWGEIVSYRDLAHAAGYANAQRAAGTFCARNRFPLFLPCHRVVSSNGLGGYGSLGAGYKRRLLELERVAF